MTDPIVTAARRAIAEALDTLRAVIGGLSAEALNWRPAGEETNSIAVLTTHAVHSTRVLLHVATGRPEPARDRPAEFLATVDGPEPLLALIDDLGADCFALLDAPGRVDWSAIRRRKRSTGEVIEMTAAWVLIHALTHLRGHTDEASLTRHVWSERS